MKALIMNCSPVRTGADGGIENEGTYHELQSCSYRSNS